MWSNALTSSNWPQGSSAPRCCADSFTLCRPCSEGCHVCGKQTCAICTPWNTGNQSTAPQTCYAAAPRLHIPLQVTFKLNAEGIQQIFAEQPHVHRAFLDNVPHNLTEAAFWDRYFKNEFRMRVSHSAALRNLSASLDASSCTSGTLRHRISDAVACRAVSNALRSAAAHVSWVLGTTACSGAQGFKLSCMAPSLMLLLAPADQDLHTSCSICCRFNGAA